MEDSILNHQNQLAALELVLEQQNKKLTPPMEAYKGDTWYNDEEESAYFIRGTSTDFRSAAHFWLTTLFYLGMAKHSPYYHQTNPFDIALAYDLAASLNYSQADFTKLKRTYGSRLFRYDLRLRGDFQRAWLINDDWDHKVALTCTHREYVAFFWMTSA